MRQGTNNELLLQQMVKILTEIDAICDTYESDIATKYIKERTSKVIDTFNSLESILSYYANSTIGKMQPDGTYILEYDSNTFGVNAIIYDPRPAQRGLAILKNLTTDTTQEHKYETTNNE